MSWAVTKALICCLGWQQNWKDDPAWSHEMPIMEEYGILMSQWSRWTQSHVLGSTVATSLVISLASKPGKALAVEPSKIPRNIPMITFIFWVYDGRTQTTDRFSEKFPGVAAGWPDRAARRSIKYDDHFLSGGRSGSPQLKKDYDEMKSLCEMHNGQNTHS